MSNRHDYPFAVFYEVFQDDMPALNAMFAKYRHELFTDIRLRTTKIFLREMEADALSSRLPSIVEPCDLARIRGRLALLYGANEAERRQAWDQFFLKAFLAFDSMEGHSIDVLYALSILSPRAIIDIIFLQAANVF